MRRLIVLFALPVTSIACSHAGGATGMTAVEAPEGTSLYQDPSCAVAGAQSDGFANAQPLGPGASRGCVALGQHQNFYALRAPAAAVRYQVRVEPEEHVCAHLYGADRQVVGRGVCADAGEQVEFSLAIASGGAAFLVVEATHSDWRHTPYRLELAEAPLADADEATTTTIGRTAAQSTDRFGTASTIGW